VTEHLYFDDPDEGPSRETSHPAFVRVCEDELFYDCTAEFGPFGNDDGADALSALEDWYREGAEGMIRSFIDHMLEEWGMTIPDLTGADRETVNRWLDDEQLAMALPAAGKLVTAVTFGQLKITGEVDAEVVALALAVNEREAALIAQYERRDPTWAHAASANTAVRLKRAVLDKLATKSGPA
jgi:uncharacterized protein YfeS